MCTIIFESLLNTFTPGTVEHMVINLFSEKIFTCSLSIHRNKVPPKDLICLHACRYKWVEGLQGKN